MSRHKPTRLYLEDLRGLQETLKRQSEREIKTVDIGGWIDYVPVPITEHQRTRELFTLCEREIRRVEKAIGRAD